jgi:hypothetical protein
LMGLCVFCGNPDEESNPNEFVLTRNVGNRVICTGCLEDLADALASIGR